MRIPTSHFEVIEMEKNAFEIGRIYANWPNHNGTMTVVDRVESSLRTPPNEHDAVQVRLRKNNGRVVRRWADVKEGYQKGVEMLIVDVEPFNVQAFFANDLASRFADTHGWLWEVDE